MERNDWQGRGETDDRLLSFWNHFLYGKKRETTLCFEILEVKNSESQNLKISETQKNFKP